MVTISLGKVTSPFGKLIALVPFVNWESMMKRVIVFLREG